MATAQAASSVVAELGLSSVKPELWDGLLHNTPTGNWPGDFSGWLRSWQLLHGSHALDEEMAFRYTQEIYRRDPRDASVAKHHVAAMATVPAELAANLKRVTAPGLVIHGMEDSLVPVDHGMAIARLIPGCRFQGLAGAGHMFFHRDLWTRLTTHILEHLRAVESKP